MKNKFCFGVLIIVFISLCMSFSAYAVKTDYVMIVVNDDRLAAPAEILGGVTYIPVRELAESVGAEIFWDETVFGATLSKGDIIITILPGASTPVYVNGTAVKDAVNCYINDEKLMLPLRFFAESFGFKVEYFDAYKIVRVTDGSQTSSAAKILLNFGEAALEERTQFNNRPAVNPLKSGGVWIDGRYRMAYNDVESFPGLHVVGNVGFEDISISEKNAKEYAEIINHIAEKVPLADTYSLLVPSMSEFYAPKEIYRSQIEGLSMVYDSLKSWVTPIDAVTALYEHGGEKLYFMTDNHWTQRGAYYAYKSFLECKNETADDINSFQNMKFDYFIGYWQKYLTELDDEKGKLAKISGNFETLERFMPKVNAEGAVYRDGHMRDYLMNVVPVDQNINSYSAFIGGDNPVTVFKTNVDNGKKICIIKDSYGNAFSAWALNNYSVVYIIDPRHVNGLYGFGGGEFKIDEFYRYTEFDDLVIINYPASVESQGFRYALSVL